MKGKGGEEGIKAKLGNVTKLFNYVPFFVNIYRGGNLVPIRTIPQPASGDLQLDDLALTNGFNYRGGGRILIT